jgi:hypothetical protein
MCLIPVIHTSEDNQNIFCNFFGNDDVKDFTAHNRIVNVNANILNWGDIELENME